MLTADCRGLRVEVLLLLGLSAVAGISGCDPKRSGKGGATSTATSSASGASIPGTDTTLPSEGLVVTPPVCENPQPFLRHGMPTGWVRCKDGRRLRQQAVECSDVVPSSTCQEGMGGTCKTNADCTAKPYGHCRALPRPNPDPNPELPTSCGCQYDCKTDADCGEDSLCLCSDFGQRPGGRCVRSNCRQASDCSTGMCEYSEEIWGIGCPGLVSLIGCRTEVDTCATVQDCIDAGDPSFKGKHICGPDFKKNNWSCRTVDMACGRPFYVDAQIRSARERDGDQWSSPSPQARADLGRAESLALAQHWIRIGLMEHASVASFSRVIMQLLSLGAPAKLVAQANKALSDEIRHAQLCFTMANRHLATPCEPGPLQVDDCLAGQLEPLAIFMGCFEEACVGETLAFLEASQAARLCQDADSRSLLMQISHDEREHALFGWAMLRWVWTQLSIQDKQQARAWLVSRIQELSATAQSPAPWERPKLDLSAQGVLTCVQQEAVRGQGIDGVLIPCTVAFLESLDLSETGERSARAS